MDHSVFCEFRHALSNAPHLSDLKNICKDFCTQLGMNYYLFGVYEVLSLSSPKLTTLTNYPVDWLDYYFQNRLTSIDPILKYSISNTSPIVWSELINKQGYNSENEIAFMEEAKSYGLCCGLTVPINPPTGQISFFSVATSNKNIEESHVGSLLPTAGIFSRYLFDAYIRIDKVENPKANTLTERELECVFWACEGKTAWEMSQIVGVAERTINFHLTSVIKKLGASNRQHAVAKAVMYGLVRPRP
jgi:LuxR family transcriptional activator of bioluminescence operon